MCHGIAIVFAITVFCPCVTGVVPVHARLVAYSACFWAISHHGTGVVLTFLLAPYFTLRFIEVFARITAHATGFGAVAQYERWVGTTFALSGPLRTVFVCVLASSRTDVTGFGTKSIDKVVVFAPPLSFPGLADFLRQFVFTSHHAKSTRHGTFAEHVFVVAFAVSLGCPRSAFIGLIRALSRTDSARCGACFHDNVRIFACALTIFCPDRAAVGKVRASRVDGIVLNIILCLYNLCLIANEEKQSKFHFMHGQ